MSKMKYSGVEWIGDIPKEWSIKKAKYITSFINGYAFDSDVMQSVGRYPVIRIGDIDGKTINFANCLFIDNNVNLEKYKIMKDDLLLAMSGATVGKTGFSYKNYEAYINQRVGIIRSCNNKFVNYFLKTSCFDEFIKLISVGSAQPNISSTNFGEFKMTFPSNMEQKLIVEFLDEKVFYLDEILSDLNKQIEILNNYKKSLITETIISGLEKQFDYTESNIEWIGKISQKAKLIRLKNSAYLKGRIGWQGLKAEEFINEGPYCVTGTDFINGKINWETCYHISNERYEMDFNIHLKIGDLLITKDGTIGKLAKVDYLPNKACLNSHLLIIRPLNKNFTNEYLYYVMSSDIFYKYSSILANGSTMNSLSQEKIGNFIFPSYDINKQKEIVDFLDKKCEQIDKIIEEKQKQIKKIEEYKKSVIYEYVTGKKRVEGAEELYG